MLPIYFNVASHLWIAYLLFVNGFLLSLLLRRFSPAYLTITDTFEAQMLMAFFASILLNGLFLLGLDYLGSPFSLGQTVIPIITAVLLVIVFASLRQSAWREIIHFGIDWQRAVLYVFVFIMLFYNGGLIEQIADSWWHMSYANKIGMASSFSLELGHLNGINARYYPPLWHANLALVNTVSDISFAKLWNSFTAWGAVLSIMSFYLLALGLSRHKVIAVISALLFVLLPGIGNSYLRVSAWPSHIAFAALFTLFFVVFRLFDQYNMLKGQNIVTVLRKVKVHSFIVLLLATVVLVTHKLELLWLGVAFIAYFIGVLFHASFSTSSISIESNKDLLEKSALVFFLIMLGITVWFAFDLFLGEKTISDQLLSRLLFVIIFLVLVLLQIKTTFFSKTQSKIIPIICWVMLVVMVILSVDSRQFWSLFDSDYAYARGRHHERALIATGWLGGNLDVSGWHLQLRSGLLYSGVLSIPLSLYLAYRKPSRMTLFIAANGLIAFLFCVSPYFYQWLRDILSHYHSPWRIAILVLHPIVLAVGLNACWSGLKNHDFKKASSYLVTLALLFLVSLIVFDSAYHFDKGLMDAKHKAQSSQRNWASNYAQKFVYISSSFRYEADFSNIKPLINPGTALFSDLATSYYAASYLPVYVNNIHRHQGRNASFSWKKFLDKRHYCYLENEASLEKTRTFVQSLKQIAEANNKPILSYIIVNRDKQNRNFRNDCFSLRQTAITGAIPKLAEKIYQGEYLDLYEL